MSLSFEPGDAGSDTEKNVLRVGYKSGIRMLLCLMKLRHRRSGCECGGVLLVVIS